MTVQQVYDYLDSKAPFALQESWDNSGLNAGDPHGRVRRILVALDITDRVIGEATELGADLIVSHHPLIFRPIKAVTLSPNDLTGRKLWNLARAGISAICCHTSLDAAEGGVNTVLAQSLGLEEISLLADAGTDRQGRPCGIGRIGKLPQPMALADFLPLVQKALAPNGLRFVEGGRPVSRVAVGGGACGDFMEAAWKAGCDTFLTSDLSYHRFLDARELSLNLVDAGHFPTENVVIPTLARWLKEGFPEAEIFISQCHKEVFHYYTAEN